MEYVITGTICLFIGVIIGVGVMGLVAGGKRKENEAIIPEPEIAYSEADEDCIRFIKEVIEDSGVCSSKAAHKKTAGMARDDEWWNCKPRN